MTARSEWNAIAARIDGFLNSTAVFVQTLTTSREDPFRAVDRVLLPESARIYQELERFAARQSSTLPQAAHDALRRFLEEERRHFTPPWSMGSEVIKRVAPALGAIRSEVSFHLADFAATARRLGERAFIHLQRSIVVDAAVRENWKAAFQQGELRCEQLGAVHLLSHGIWAFKVDAAGERTDLLFSDRAIQESQVESAAEALVLTEWKKVLRPPDSDARAEEARSQAARYAAGSLVGIELAAYRYVVLVSEEHLESLTDLRDGDVTYRHINIAVAPKVPSRS